MNTPTSPSNNKPTRGNNSSIISTRMGVMICLLWLFMAARFIVNSQQNSLSPAVSPTTLRINPNRAEPWELTALPGIGDTRADAIINQRNNHASFTQADDLQHIQGIGPITTARLKSYLRFDN